MKAIRKFFGSVLLLDLLKGLFVTGKYLFSRKITVEYPEEKTPLSPRFRGMHALLRHEDGSERCVACKLCEATCPAMAITVDSGMVKEGVRGAVRYDIDQNRCIFCGMCEQSCPVDAIVHTGLFEYAGQNRRDLYFVKEELLAVGDAYAQEIVERKSKDAAYV